jgi:hypothetical protein
LAVSSEKPKEHDIRRKGKTMNKEHLAIRRLAAVAVSALAFSLGGCGPPQASPENQQLISSLRTALSARNPDWLEQNAEILQERRAAGRVSDEVFSSFRAIIEKARDGRWEEAEREALALQKAQRPQE